MATHNANIAITIFLAALAATAASFSDVLIIVPLATNPLGGNRSKTYTSAAAAAADVPAVIDAAAADEVAAAFAQTPAPARVIVGYWDTTTPETAAAALAAQRAYNDTFYGIAIRSNVTADILAWSIAVEADGEKFFMAQTAVAAGGTDAAFATIAANKRTAIVFHGTATAYNDVGYLAKGLAFNPDVQSAGWAALQVAGVAAPTVTDADRATYISDQINVMGSIFGLANVMDAGVRYDGGEIKERITADWLRARIRERVATVWVKAANRGQPVTLDAQGLNMIEAVLDQTFQQAEAARHTTTGTDPLTGDPTPSYRVTSRSIDVSTRKLLFTVVAQIAGTARLFDFSFYLDNDPVTA